MGGAYYPKSIQVKYLNLAGAKLGYSLVKAKLWLNVIFTVVYICRFKNYAKGAVVRNKMFETVALICKHSQTAVTVKSFPD